MTGQKSAGDTADQPAKALDSAHEACSGLKAAG